MQPDKKFLCLAACLLSLAGYRCAAAADGILINDFQIVPEEQKEQKEDTTAEIFGRRGGYLHPYLSLRGEYTDNLYNVGVDEKTNFLTVVSPGIWFARPAVTQVPVTINPRNTASGGLRLGIQEKETFNRFLSYLLGGLDFEMYSENSDLDATNYHLEGMFQYNLRGGLSFRILDRFAQDQDKFDVNSFTIEDVRISPQGISLTEPSNVRRYRNNLAAAALNWDITEKITARLDYTNFILDYDGSTNDWLNRTDNGLNAYLYYDYSVKTSFFGEYRYVNAHYNDGHRGMNPESLDVEDRDNQQNFFYGGINWKTTEKTSFMAKVGFQDKSYDSAGFDSQNTLVYELLANYRITEKTSIKLSLYKALEESNTFEANGKDTTMVRFNYSQRIYNRFNLLIDLSYFHDDYEQNYADYDVDIFQRYLPDGREDDRYYIKPALQYIFLDWLMAEVSYTYDSRDSSRELYDYTTNAIMFSINSAL